MKKLVSTFVFISLFLSVAVVSAQSVSSFAWPDSLNTAKDVPYLSDMEKEVVHEMNKARTNPKVYAEYLKSEREYYNGLEVNKPGETILQTNEGVAALDECIRFLETAVPVSVLKPSEGLSRAAKDHVNDQAKTGETGHTGSDGSSISERTGRYGKWSGNIGENISYGNRNARQIVFDFLVDDGMKSRGHRDNIMKPSFGVCGLATGSHSEYKRMCVIDYATGFADSK